MMTHIFCTYVIKSGVMTLIATIQNHPETWFEVIHTQYAPTKEKLLLHVTLM